MAAACAWLCRQPGRRGGDAILSTWCAGHASSNPVASIPSAAPFEKLLEQLAFRPGSHVRDPAPFHVTAKTVAQIGIHRAPLRAAVLSSQSCAGLNLVQPGTCAARFTSFHFGRKPGLQSSAKRPKKASVKRATFL